jgi:two-component system, OmpR family, phosphate regulon response regulator PhoB
MMLANNSKKQILIVDRDVAVVEPLREKLGEAGFVVRAITDSSAAFSAVTERPPHLIIIDWNMPGFAAYDLVNSLRKRCATQTIRLVILSALAEEDHVVMGLDLGADDYITKPYSMREVVARVSVLLRSHGSLRKNAALKIGELVLDSDTNRVTAQGKLITLRGVEYRLLEFLMSHSGKTFNRNQLLNQVWGGSGDVDERTVDVNVQRLRKILSAQGYESYIQTVRGFGYRFAQPAVDCAD